MKMIIIIVIVIIIIIIIIIITILVITVAGKYYLKADNVKALCTLCMETF